jgi:uncharacterized protein (DUF983 family)
MPWDQIAAERLPRKLWPAALRGFAGRCPQCGVGHMFRAFLKVHDHCPHCGEALHHQRADDAPAYFVILIVGHLVVPLALSVEVALSPSYWWHLVLWGPLTIGLALGLLQPVKGVIVAAQWANYMHGFDRQSPPELTPVPLADPAGRPS